MPGGPRVRFAVTDAEAGQAGYPGRAAVVKDAGDDPDVTQRCPPHRHRGLAPGRPPGRHGRTARRPGRGHHHPARSGPAGRRPGHQPGPDPDDPRRGRGGDRPSRGAHGLGARAARPWRPAPPTPASASSAASASWGPPGSCGRSRPRHGGPAWSSRSTWPSAQGRAHIVLSTGGRTDAAAQRLLPDLPAVCFVEVGDFTGIALRRAAAAGMRRVTFVGMAGKITKLAAGVLMTHYRRSRVDGATARRGGPPERRRAGGAGRRPPPPPRPAISPRSAWRATAGSRWPNCAAGPRPPARPFVHGALSVDVVMVDFEGDEVIARG